MPIHLPMSIGVAQSVRNPYSRLHATTTQQFIHIYKTQGRRAAFPKKSDPAAKTDKVMTVPVTFKIFPPPCGTTTLAVDARA